MTITQTIDVPDVGPLPLTFDEYGSGPAVLLLHGGGGPGTVSAFATQLADTASARVLVPVHPGFNGTPRPPELSTIRALARVYAAAIETLGLSEVTVIGNSIGGWIAAELALLAPQLLKRSVLVDAVGIEVPEHPVVDFFSLSFDEIAQHSYFKPEAFGIDPEALPPAARDAMAGNRNALRTYGGTTMVDPTLVSRLSQSTVPTLVVWGAADRIADPDYGRAYAAAIPGAHYVLLPETGHLPQIESPQRLLAAIAA